MAKKVAQSAKTGANTAVGIGANASAKVVVKTDAVIDADTSVGAGADIGKDGGELNEEFMAIDSDAVEFDNEEEVVAAPRANQKDPTIRRKIEDLLERRRLREELGIYDDEAWEGL